MVVDRTEVRWIAVALIAAIVVLTVAHVVLALLGATDAQLVDLDRLGGLCSLALSAVTGLHLAGGSGE